MLPIKENFSILQPKIAAKLSIVRLKQNRYMLIKNASVSYLIQNILLIPKFKLCAFERSTDQKDRTN